MESQAEDSERGTEGELKCLGRASEGPGSVSGAGWTMRAERFPGGTVGILGVTGVILWGLNGIQGGIGVFLAEKFESPTRCIENLAPPIGPRPFEPVQSLLERTACPAKTSIYATKAATKAGKPLLFLALRWIINPFHGLASLFRPCRGLDLALSLPCYSALPESMMSGFFTLCENRFQF